jgi:Domain of unknown function (DUF1905)/Bacteriocin-protection, YdeI or OmpD-Associated
MIKFTATIDRFDKKGEKSGWQFVEVSAARAKKMSDSNKSFRVKGKIDAHPLEKKALLPMGDGSFILPVDGDLRKAIGKKHGDKVTLVLELDERKLTLSADLMVCLKEDPEAMKFFKSLPPSHQNYYSNWIESAKTAQTKTKRIVIVMNGFSKKMTFGEMMREGRVLAI